MVEPFYGTRPSAPAAGRLGRAVACLGGLALLVACDGGSTGTPPASPPAVAASDRDASLEAIDRWLQAGRTDLAESVSRVLVDRLPRDRHARAALGRVLLARSGELRALAGESAGEAIASDAAAELRIAIDLATVEDATTVATRRSLGLALEASNRLDEAIAVYADGGDDPTCRLYLGLAQLRSGRVTEATAVLDDLALARRDDPLVRAALAEARFREGRLEDALEAADEAVRLDPDAWPIRVRRASILRRADDARSALESLLALDATAQSERPVVEEIAACWSALDRPARAAETWANRARTVDGDLEASLMAARLFDVAGRPEESEAWMEIATLSSPDDARVAETRRAIDEARAARRTDDDA